MIRVGLIGCGEHSEGQHATPLARYKNAHPDEIELAAVCDLKLERAEYFCEKYAFLRAYREVEEMLAGESLDGCIAVVPVEKIPQVGMMLLRAGVPCEVEKPLGSSLEEVKELMEAARRTGTPNMVSVNRRFMPFLNRAVVWSRSAGPLRYVRCTFTRHNRSEPAFLWETAVHAVDALRHIAGNVAEASVQMMKHAEEGGKWYAIDVRFESGVSGRIDVLPTSGVLEETYELHGEGYRAVVTCPFGAWRGLRCFRENRLEIEETDAGLAEDVVNGSYDEAAGFVGGLASGEGLRPSIEDVFPSVELCWTLTKRVAEREQAAVRL